MKKGKILKLDEILKSKKIQQKDLAFQLGFSRVTISSWCNNKSTPSLETLLKISKMLGLKLSDLVNEDFY